MLLRVVYCLIIITFLVGCEKNPQFESTRQMVNTLTRLAEKAQLTEHYPYFTKAAIDRYKIDLKIQPPGLFEIDRLNYALVLLMAGRNQECIEEVKTYLMAIDELEQVTASSIRFHKLLAYAYLREGEQYNCIKNHSNESCIIPIKGGGIHQEKWGAENAIRRYQMLLEFDPEDLHSRWFLNIAYMATDNYPEGVPDQYLIQESVFDSDISFKRFSDVAMSTGVAPNNHAGGCIIEDLNNDGFLDIFTTSYGLKDQSKLYLNDKKGSFNDHTAVAGLNGLVGGLNCIQGDYDNDGLIDLLIFRGAWLKENGRFPNSLLKNMGNGRFKDVTKEAGLLTFHPTGTGSFADIDLDGDLDLFIGNESEPGSQHPSELFLNNGDGTFTDIAGRLGLKIAAYVKGVSWGDINNDLLPDLFISVYGGSNLLFVNRTSGTDIRFEEISFSAGTAEPQYSFPCWFWDVNHDGWDDIMVFAYSNFRPDLIPVEVLKDYLNIPFATEIPRVYLNNGDETFTERAKEMGLNTVLYTMGANFGDLDNDGYLDFYTGNGEFNMLATVPNRMFKNEGGKIFLDVTTSGGFGQLQKGHGIAFGDMDNDGDQDIYHQVGGAAEGDIYHNMLFENPGFENHWITIKLRGKSSNHFGVGSRIKAITSEGSTFYHKVSSGGSFGASSLQVEMGIGKASKIDTLIVEWANMGRTRQVFTDLNPNNTYVIDEQTGIRSLAVERIQLNQGIPHHE